MLKVLWFLLLTQEVTQLRDWRQEAVTPIAVDLHHVQGIDVEDGVLWVSSVEAKAGKGYLSRIDLKTGKLLLQVEVQQGKRIHPGGIMLDGESIWIPVAEYDRDGPTNMERRNKRTLELEASFEVDDHIGCVAVGKDRVYGGSWSSRTLYEWTREGKQLRKVANPQPTSWQDMKMDGGLLMGSGLLGRQKGAVDWVSLADFSLVKQLETHATDRGYSYAHEGMTLRGGKLYFLPEDAPSRLFVFAR